MTEHARLDATATIVVEVVPEIALATFPPSFAAQFSVVPDGTLMGDTLVNGAWVRPSPPPPPPSATTTLLSTIEYFDRFMPQEEAAIRASTDSVVKVILGRLDDSRVLSIDTSSATVIQGVGYLVSIKLIDASRVAAILAPKLVSGGV